RGEVDAAGYDPILESRGGIRHVQLKASRKGARTSRQTINAKLQERQGGCIVWVFYAVQAEDCRAQLTYRWREAATLPERRGRHTRGGKEKENTRVILKGDFEAVPDTAALVDRLFGDSQG